MISCPRAVKLENATTTMAFTIFSRGAIVWVTTNRKMIASKALGPRTGSRPNPGKVSTTGGAGGKHPVHKENSCC